MEVQWAVEMFYYSLITTYTIVILLFIYKEHNLLQPPHPIDAVQHLP